MFHINKWSAGTELCHSVMLNTVPETRYVSSEVKFLYLWYPVGVPLSRWWSLIPLIPSQYIHQLVPRHYFWDLWFRVYSKRSTIMWRITVCDYDYFYYDGYWGILSCWSSRYKRWKELRRNTYRRELTKIRHRETTLLSIGTYIVESHSRHSGICNVDSHQNSWHNGVWDVMGSEDRFFSFL